MDEFECDRENSNNPKHFNLLFTDSFLSTCTNFFSIKKMFICIFHKEFLIFRLNMKRRETHKSILSIFCTCCLKKKLSRTIKIRNVCRVMLWVVTINNEARVKRTLKLQASLDDNRLLNILIIHRSPLDPSRVPTIGKHWMMMTLISKIFIANAWTENCW